MAKDATLDRLDGCGEPSEPASEEERIKFTNDAFHELKSDPDKFEEFVKLWEVGVWANKVNASFDTVTRRLEGMDTEYRAKFPELTNYLNEWRGFRKVGSTFRLAYTL